MDSEQVYSHELARRSVARAALHMGIETISEEALDVLADVLLSHIERIGRAMSKLVESSGRTSAHTNILDAMEAIHRTTSVVANQLHRRDEEDTAATTTTTTTATATTAWQDLALFCFGPPTATRADAVGGKGVATPAGWIAPFLEDVAPFPLASDACANPHPKGLSLYSAAEVLTEVTEDDTPEEAFLQKEWGALAGPTAKKRKVEPGDHAATTAAANVDSPKPRPSHIPKFLPPYPDSSQQMVRSIVETVDTVAPSTDEPSAVRSSLVDLRDGVYWGALDAAAAATPVVQPGLKDDSGIPTATINPLARASVSRVSKILEGSMDQMT
jgi:hypothetical protein